MHGLYGRKGFDIALRERADVPVTGRLVRIRVNTLFIEPTLRDIAISLSLSIITSGRSLPKPGFSMFFLSVILVFPEAFITVDPAKRRGQTPAPVN